MQQPSSLQSAPTPLANITNSLRLYGEVFPALSLITGATSTGPSESNPSFIKDIVKVDTSSFLGSNTQPLTLSDRLELNIDNILRDAPYLRGMMQTLTSFKNAGVSPDQLSAFTTNVQGMLGNLPMLAMAAMGHEKPLYLSTGADPQPIWDTNGHASPVTLAFQP